MTLSQMMESPQSIGAIVAVVVYLTLTTFQSTVPLVSDFKNKYDITRNMSPVLFSVGVGSIVFLAGLQKDRMFGMLSGSTTTSSPVMDWESAQMAPNPMGFS